MFYVIYDTASKSYLNAEGAFSEYDKAQQFNSHADAKSEIFEMSNYIRAASSRVVGPCIEGEEP